MTIIQNPIKFDHLLPATAVELLLVLVDTAEQYQLKTIPCREVWVESHMPPQIAPEALPHPKDPLGSLEKLGLIERLNQDTIHLRAAAFTWAKYKRKNWLGKRWLKIIHR